MVEVFRTITQLVVSPHAPQQLTKVEGEWRRYELSLFNPSVSVLLFIQSNSYTKI